MPKGPKGEKRPADVIGNAFRVMRIATGEKEDVVPASTAGAALGKLGGKAMLEAKHNGSYYRPAIYQTLKNLN
jgi:hypothetical protein